jgi:pimeloyl-ACP methyl ester carboxylesterase
VPLETDSTAPLAYMLNDSSIWSQLGPKRFLSSGQQKPELILTQPYVPGRIPVVFVHGTAGSPLWWAEMWNTLHSDPVMRKRFQFWFFMYNSSIPIVISAKALRNSLSEQVRKLDPEGKDPALQEMVVIGHSQGGLLAKMTVVRTGDLLRHSLNNLSTDELDLTPEMKQLVIFESSPFVKRVVFISTPHRGSYLAVSLRNFIRKFVDLPADVVKLSADFLSLNKGKLKMPKDMEGKIPTSMDDMTSTNPWLIALAELPITPDVAANSIISVKGEGDYHQGDDGVVQYASAHLEGVESEFIVRSEHSCQGNPLVIEEVRRILVKHLAPARVTGEKRRQLSDLQLDSTQNRKKKFATEFTEGTEKD